MTRSLMMGSLILLAAVSAHAQSRSRRGVVEEIRKVDRERIQAQEDKSVSRQLKQHEVVLGVRCKDPFRHVLVAAWKSNYDVTCISYYVIVGYESTG